MKILVSCLLVALLFPVSHDTNQNAQPFRIVPIVKKENGYGGFETVALRSQKEFDDFLKATTTQHGWNYRQKFEDELRSANIDFSKEALVLLRHTEGSGSVKVEFKTPVLEGKKLICEIEGIPIPPGYLGTGDMAYYCQAVVVSKADVSQVEFRATQGGFKAKKLNPVVLSIQ